MTTKLEATLIAFQTKRKEVVTTHAAAKVNADLLRKEYEEKKLALETEFTNKVNEALQPARNLAEQYRAELKAWLGFTDGEGMDVLQVAEAFSRLHQDMTTTV